jgi:S-DNA-T family DNA segregation ATPase FtsK/SpoIIIE
MGKTANNKRKRGSEIVAILYLAVGVYLLISLLSYSPADPSLLGGIPGAGPVRNLGGRIGAYLSDAGLQALGIAVIALPFLVALAGWTRLRGVEGRSRLARWSGGALFLIGLCAFFHVLFGEVTLRGAPHAAGGMVGVFLGWALLPALSRGGLLLLSVVLIAVGFLVATRLSLRDSLASIRRHADLWGQRLRLKITRSIDARRRARMRDAVIRKHRQMSSDRPKVTAKGPGGKTPPSGPGRAKPRTSTRIMRKTGDGPAKTATQPPLPLPETPAAYVLPPLSLLDEPAAESTVDDKQLVEIARKITARFREFGVEGSVLQIHPGPVVTTYEFKPEPGIKYNRITGLSEELCLAVQAESIRIDRISGKSTIGIEVPNPSREVISLRELLAAPRFMNSPSRLTLSLGRRIHGEPYVADLASMPHLLIAGATGSGKSVSMNGMITSILYKATPEEVKFIMIDTKRLELGFYQDIPHLLTPVVAEPKKAAAALRWAVLQMEQRYRQLADCGVRTLDQYNQLLAEGGIPRGGGNGDDRQEHDGPLPFIVIVIDELADLMIVSGKEVEESITRLAQMARAVGIHLIISTQRPSVDVITGVIKANLPCRIALRVSTRVDSRTILDGNGAEQLLGNGDMLFMPPGSARLIRLHGPLLTEVELARVVRHLSRQGKAVHDVSVTREKLEKKESATAGADDRAYPDAVRMVVQSGQASISHLQRRLRLGYARAARLVDQMEAEGIVGPADGSRAREVLVDNDFLYEMERRQAEEG